MKVGFIFECGPQGADKQVCEYLAHKIRPDISPISRTLDNKLRLLQECGPVAAQLLADGCERVLVVWDLRPAWPNKKHKACLHIERLAVLDSLQKAGAANHKVFLVCVEQELESWLLADEKGLEAFLSTPTHVFPIGRTRCPDQVQNPKSVVMNYFQQARHWRYEDRVHVVKVLQASNADLKRLRRSKTFGRFEIKLLVSMGAENNVSIVPTQERRNVLYAG